MTVVTMTMAKQGAEVYTIIKAAVVTVGGIWTFQQKQQENQACRRHRPMHHLVVPVERSMKHHRQQQPQPVHQR